MNSVSGHELGDFEYFFDRWLKIANGQTTAVSGHPSAREEKLTESRTTDVLEVS